jgi:hypothetical protein
MKKYAVEEASINNTAIWSDSIAAIAVYFNTFPVIDLTLFAFLDVLFNNFILAHFAQFPLPHIWNWIYQILPLLPALL